MNPSYEGSRPALDPERRRALAILWRGAAGVVLGGLQGCGGGGGDASAPVPAPPPAPPAGPIAAQMSVPAPSGYGADRLAAFDRLNAIRLAAGLGMLAQDTLLDQAAQSHADWIIANDSFTHVEAAGTPGFTGGHWWDRAEALGYVPIGGEEVISGDVPAIHGVNALVNALYHRAALLAFEPVDVGIGWSAQAAASIATPLVVVVSRPATDPARSSGQQPQASLGGACTWPAAGAQGVPRQLGLESPNPVPSQAVLSLGTPVSITVSEDKVIAVDTFTLTDLGTGASVACELLLRSSDPNALLPGSFAALVPLGLLDPGATYRADFAGSTVDNVSGTRASIDRSWTFETAAA